MGHLTPADVCFGRSRRIIDGRKEIKRRLTIAQRRRPRIQIERPQSGRCLLAGGAAELDLGEDAPVLNRRALFLDRDGVINVDHRYVHRQERFIWTDGVFELGREAHRRGYSLVIVTNQSGIGRGLYTEAAFVQLTKWMCSEMARQGAPLTRVYYCPHHPEAKLEQFRADHPWRKPSPGMILQARDDLGLDLSQSILLGDRASDILAATRAGVGTSVLVGRAAEVATLELAPTAIVPHVRSAIAWFVENAEGRDAGALSKAPRPG